MNIALKKAPFHAPNLIYDLNGPKRVTTRNDQDWKKGQAASEACSSSDSSSSFFNSLSRNALYLE